MGVEIIAEIAQAHEGSLGVLHSYIDALAKTGVDTVKFQTHIAEAESSSFEPFRVKFSYEDKTRFDYWQRMEFSFEQWRGIKQHCEEVGLKFLSSPFSNKAVELLENLEVDRYKIGSGETTNLLMLEKVARTGKDVILSTGMSSFVELDKSISFLKSKGCGLSVLQCTTKYPTEAEDIGLNVLADLKSRYNVPVGLSDHSGKIYPSIAAVALGAEIVEVHAVFDRQMFGPDSSSSLTISEIEDLAQGVKFINKSLDNEIDKNDCSGFDDVKTIFEKSLAVNREKKAGEEIVLGDLEAKKPANRGIAAQDYRRVVGRRINCDLKKWDFLDEGMLDV